MMIGEAGAALDTIQDTRAAMLETVESLEKLYDDDKVKLPKRHLVGLEAAMSTLGSLADALADLGQSLEDKGKLEADWRPDPSELC